MTLNLIIDRSNSVNTVAVCIIACHRHGRSDVHRITPLLSYYFSSRQPASDRRSRHQSPAGEQSPFAVVLRSTIAEPQPSWPALWVSCPCIFHLPWLWRHLLADV